MVVLDELLHRCSQLPLREEDHSAEALLLDRADEALGEGV
jgi:hypothetical protein